MILDERNKKPFINFGFNLIEKTAPSGVFIDVYLDSIYNLDEYDSFTLSSTGATVTKVNNYYYKVKYSTSGSYTINMTIQNRDKSIVLNSNIINITIV